MSVGEPPKPSMTKGHVLWVGSAGTGSAYGLIRSVREVWGDSVHVIAADINEPHLVPGAILADQFVQVPLVAAPDFVPFMTGALVDKNVDTYVPLLDAELVAASRIGAAIPTDSVIICAPPEDTASLCLDKLTMARWLAEHAFPTPDTVPVSDFVWTGQPVFAKPRLGLGSVGARVIASVQALAVAQLDDGLVIQPLCEPPEVTVDAFRSRDGQRMRAVGRERLVVKAGVCTKARVFDDDAVTKLTASLMEALGISGAVCIQLMRAADGSGWQITDVNPRLGSGTRMSAKAGVDVAAAALADVWGEDASRFLPPLSGERFVIRTYDEWLT